jgi:RNA polymerase sigma-70 factor (ECF subfamily)
MLPPSDDQLIERVARSEEQALLALYDRYASRVYALVVRILDDPPAAEEVTQDVFLKLWTRARSHLASKGPVLNWLLTIARNAALDRLRLERRRPPPGPMLDPESDGREASGPDGMADEHRWRSLYFAVRSIPAEQREVIELAYYGGLTHSQIAEHLGLPLGTVKTRLRAGIQRLRREWLAEPEDGEPQSKTGPRNV